MAGKKWIVTPEILALVERRAKEGATEYKIAEEVGLAGPTFSTKKKEYPELAEAVRRGTEKVITQAQTKLYDIMMDDNHKGQLTALIFFLKCRAGWKDTTNNIILPENKAPKGMKFKLIEAEVEEEDEQSSGDTTS